MTGELLDGEGVAPAGGGDSLDEPRVRAALEDARKPGLPQAGVPRELHHALGLGRRGERPVKPLENRITADDGRSEEPPVGRWAAH